MVADILPLIPEHNTYVEPFFGGGSVFWAKPPSHSEIMNDYNGNVINFYSALKNVYFELKKKVDATLHSRETHKAAIVIYNCPWLFDEVTRSWAFFVLTNQSFCANVKSRGADRCVTFQNKVGALTENLSYRLKYAQAENNMAHLVIKSTDNEDAFFYVDPPYINSDQGHYGGYTEERFWRELDTLADIKGKFLLSSYPSTLLDGYIKANGRHSKQIIKRLSAGRKAGRTKTEVPIANYPLV